MAGAPVGGAELFFERLVPALARAGVEQHAVIRRHPRRSGALRAAGVTVGEVSFSTFDILGRWRFRREIERFQPDIVLTWMNRATTLCPTGRFVHAARLGGYYNLKYYRRCHHLVANTRDIAEYLVREGFPAARVHYLPNFVDAEPAAVLPRREFDTPEEAPLLVALGRLHPNKGFDVLLAALAEIPNAHLWLAGKGPLRDELVRQAEALGVSGRVRFLGWRQDVAALLATADVYVCPSRHEPLGNTILEAWAHGCPLVAAASQGPAALVTDRESGMLVPVDDAPALAAALRELLGSADLRAALREGGRAAWRASFTETAVVDAYRDFFSRIGSGS